MPAARSETVARLNRVTAEEIEKAIKALHDEAGRSEVNRVASARAAQTNL